MPSVTSVRRALATVLLTCATLATIPGAAAAEPALCVEHNRLPHGAICAYYDGGA